MPDTYLGCLPRPFDPAELRYSLTRTLPPRAVNLSEPRLLSRWQGRDVRIPIQDQGPVGSCAAWASLTAAMMAGRIAGRTDVEMLAAGPLYEQARRLRGWWPQDTGSYIADNCDLLLPGGPRIIEPYSRDAAWDYNEDAWSGQSARDYAASHRPIYPADGAFAEHVWAALDAGLPVVFGSIWPDRWFTPNAGVVDADAPFSDRTGGHAYVCWGITPGYYLCQNSWSKDWSHASPMLGHDMRAGDFAVPFEAADRGIIWEARAISAEAVLLPPEPELNCAARVDGYLAGKEQQWSRSYTKRAAAREIRRELAELLA